MNISKTHIITAIVTSGFFLVCDQYLKFIASRDPMRSYYIWKSWLGWEYFENPGIAFGIPVPSSIVISITPIIIAGILWWLYFKNKCTISMYGGICIIAGAFSNFIDRIFYSITIDYIRILTSLINLADVLIIVGAGLIVIDHWESEATKIKRLKD
ncbi:MAG: signal peptidase II [Candidatus Magasanikbacteria bacterium]